MKILVITKDIENSIEKIRNIRWDGEMLYGDNEAIFKNDKLSLTLKAIEVKDKIYKTKHRAEKCHLVLYDGEYTAEEIDSFEENVICNNTFFKVIDIDSFMRNNNNMSLELIKSINKNLESLLINYYKPVIKKFSKEYECNFIKNNSIV